MDYCMYCGNKLQLKNHGNEGIISYCNHCKRFIYPIYYTAVSLILRNTIDNKILLIKQYGKPYYILVAGYIRQKESAEDAARRELLEETGLEMLNCKINKTKFFEPSNTLMINFTCWVSSKFVNSNNEIDFWDWFDPSEACQNIKPNSLAKEFLVYYFESQMPQMF